MKKTGFFSYIYICLNKFQHYMLCRLYEQQAQHKKKMKRKKERTYFTYFFVSNVIKTDLQFVHRHYINTVKMSRNPNP